MIIKATYYTVAGDESTYHSAVQATQIWNEQNGQYRYIVGKGSDAVTYDVHFQLNVIEVDNPTQVANTDRMSPEMAESLGKTKLTPDQSSNTYGILPDDHKIFENGEEGKSTNGVTTAGALINIKESRKNTDTGAHEIGHTLGLAHFKKGVLTAASNDPNRSKSISSGYIKGIISNAIKKKDERVGKGTLHETGISPGSFKKGKIEKK